MEKLSKQIIPKKNWKGFFLLKDHIFLYPLNQTVCVRAHMHVTK